MKQGDAAFLVAHLHAAHPEINQRASNHFSIGGGVLQQHTVGASPSAVLFLCLAGKQGIIGGAQFLELVHQLGVAFLQAFEAVGRKGHPAADPIELEIGFVGLLVLVANDDAERAEDLLRPTGGLDPKGMLLLAHDGAASASGMGAFGLTPRGCQRNAYGSFFEVGARCANRKTPPARSQNLPMSSLLQTLEDRGFLHDCTDIEGLRKLTGERSVTVYCGFDPTADSLTIGNLVALMGLLHFQRCGHRPLVLMGGATGMIGDPGGKSAERNLQTIEQVQYHMACQRPQFEKFLRFEGENAAKIVNNYDWTAPVSFIDFLRDVGKMFRIGEMLGKESVRARINSEAGISYTEFSYQLLQAFDFKHLYEAEGCEVQCGGADQWGNITAGMDYIRKTISKQAYGLTFPLITTASGEKLGKTAKGAVWLSPAKTPIYDFYQYWVRAEDRDAERFLKLFTLLDIEEIAAIMAEHQQAPEKRTAQKRLAWEVTRFVHSEEEARKAREASEALYSGNALANASDDQMRELFADAPSIEVSLDGDGADLLEVLVEAKLASSKKEARKLVQQAGLYLNNEVVPAEKRALTRDDLASESMMILRAGKKRYCLVRAK